MRYSAILRPVLLGVSGALAAGVLVACGDDEAGTTETTTTETTQTTENEGTIEVPSPDVTIPSPDVDLPEVTVTPNP